MTDCGDWDATTHYYYDGQRMIETRNGSDQLCKQYVWGMTYVDELVQVGLTLSSGNTSCSRFFHALQDANYNVLGVVDHTGRLVERYEYTPYG